MTDSKELIAEILAYVGEHGSEGDTATRLLVLAERHLNAVTLNRDMLGDSLESAYRRIRADADDAERYRWIRSKTDCRHGTTFTMPAINTLIGIRPFSDGPQSYLERFDSCVDATMRVAQEVNHD